MTGRLPLTLAEAVSETGRRTSALRQGIRSRLVDIKSNAKELDKMTTKLLEHALVDSELEAISGALTSMVLALQVVSTEIVSCSDHR